VEKTSKKKRQNETGERKKRSKEEEIKE